VHTTIQAHHPLHLDWTLHQTADANHKKRVAKLETRSSASSARPPVRIEPDSRNTSLPRRRQCHDEVAMPQPLAILTHLSGPLQLIP